MSFQRKVYERTRLERHEMSELVFDGLLFAFIVIMTWRLK